jgi:hypothetical protein
MPDHRCNLLSAQPFHLGVGPTAVRAAAIENELCLHSKISSRRWQTFVRQVDDWRPYEAKSTILNIETKALVAAPCLPEDNMRVDFIGGLFDGDSHQVSADVFQPRYTDVLNP